MTLVEAFVEFVISSESVVTYLSNPRLMTSQETVFSIQRRIGLDLNTVLSVLNSYLHIKRWASEGVVKKKSLTGCHPFTSPALVHSLQIAATPKLSNNMTGFVANVCPAETVTGNSAPLETSPLV